LMSVSLGEMLSLSPEVRAQAREDVTTKHTPPLKGPDTTTLLQTKEEEPLAVFRLEQGRAGQPVPEGATVIPDPIEMSMQDSSSPNYGKMVTVGMESLPLRSILPIVDNQMQVECILDPGSQIVAMAEEVCLKLALPYDPSVVLNMQSANGEVDQSLGLARNVPFCIGDITVYLQVHVLRKPVYQILLGRPFDILMASIVRNFDTTEQTITIQDPNTGRTATLPTIERGSFKLIRARIFTA
ncbi:hypothetical protein BV22DRAFT_1025456, partial [Leucogyrophana mollusca]